jgi:hypothetical protein
MTLDRCPSERSFTCVVDVLHSFKCVVEVLREVCASVVDIPAFCNVRCGLQVWSEVCRESVVDVQLSCRSVMFHQVDCGSVVAVLWTSNYRFTCVVEVRVFLHVHHRSVTSFQVCRGSVGHSGLRRDCRPDTKMVDRRLPGEGNSNSHGARPIY